MIYSKNILAGYTILRGTAIIHIPLWLVMVLCPRYDDQDTQWKFGIPIPEAESIIFSGGQFFWWIAFFQHLLLSGLHVVTFIHQESFSGSILPMALEGLKMITILAQVLLFISAMNLFG